MSAPRTRLTPFETRVLAIACVDTTFAQVFSALDSCATHEGSVFLDGDAGEIEIEVTPEDSDSTIATVIEGALSSASEGEANATYEDHIERSLLGC